MADTNVLMFGWEFPPMSSGGLGTASYGLTKGLSRQGAKVTFVIPRNPDSHKAQYVDLLSMDDFSNVRIRSVKSLMTPYMTSAEYYETLKKKKIGPSSMYGKNLFEEVHRYTEVASFIAKREKYNVIHAHDWMTYRAGMKAKKISGKPLVVHVHATEFDRTGGHGVNPYVYNIEKEGMQYADMVVAVSNYTKNKIVENYGIDPNKIKVVHNAVEFTNFDEQSRIATNDKVVLFLGRITLQKGPDYFIETAKRVLEFDQNVKFVVAGNGDMEHRMIERAAQLGIADKVLFTGFLTGQDIDRAYKMADLYVMPSVSEPFGITPLEAMRNGTPVLISKQSGVSEVISHCLKADFWDIAEMTNKIVSVLKHKELQQTLAHHGAHEVKKFNWDIPARKCIEIYNKVRGGQSNG